MIRAFKKNGEICKVVNHDFMEIEYCPDLPYEDIDVEPTANIKMVAGLIVTYEIDNDGNHINEVTLTV